MIVVDASLAAKWFLIEADSASAERFLLRYSYDLCGPDLLMTEVASTLVREANIGKSRSANVRSQLADWHGMIAGGVVRTERLGARRLGEASLIALDLGHPLADCIYLQMAMERDCALATCDQKFRIKALRLYGKIRLLHQFDD